MIRARAMTAVLAPLLATVSQVAFAQQVEFRVPRQAAVTGIPEFARQAKIQIVSPAGLAGLQTRSVEGRFTVEQGLRILLRGTGLRVVARNGNVVSLALRPQVVKRRTVPAPVRRATAPPRPPRRAAAPPSAPPPEIIVTGTIAPERKLDAGLAITTASLDRIHELAPNNSADLLKIAPGIWAETTGGATGANVFVRGFPTTGDAPFLTAQIDGAPIFPPTELAFSENTTLVRVDDMVERVEILRGGTSPIFSNGQPGAVINFIQRTGTAQPGGGLRLTATDYGTRRVDGYLTGPLSQDTHFAIGGFYRKSDGIRDTQFAADRGGQIGANLTHEFAEGRVTAYMRYTRDHNAFYTGVPLISNGSGRFSALPGFDPLRDTLLGRDTRRLSIEAGPGDFLPVDTGEGRGLDLLVAGTTVQWSPNARIDVTNRMNFTSGEANTVSLFTGAVPVTLGRYIADSVARANADPRVILAAGTASTGEGVLAASGLPLSVDRLVLVAGLWSVKKTIRSFTDELRVSTTIDGGHRLTGGLYVADYRSDDVRRFGNNLLLLAEPNARRIDLRLDNGVAVSRDGFVSATTNQVVGTSGATNIAIFVHDKWQITERTSLDAGIRLERQSLRGQVRQLVSNVDFDGNPLTLYDNNGALLLETATPVSDRANRFSWSVGLIHRAIPDRLTLHARLNHGSNMLSFEKLRIGGRRTQSADVFEAGAELSAGPARVSVNAFVNRFEGLQFGRLIAQPDGGVGSIVLLGGARARGIELDAEIAPSPRWTVEVRGSLLDARYRGFGENNGNRVVRQPTAQFSITPVYAARLGPATVKLRATYSFVGGRYSDVENLQRLPSYETVDAGLHVDFDNGLYFDLVAQNLLDAFGLTEGNTRLRGDVLSSGPIVARPLFGRNVSASLGFRF